MWRPIDERKGEEIKQKEMDLRQKQSLAEQFQALQEFGITTVMIWEWRFLL
jgi:hypothetical protein